MTPLLSRALTWFKTLPPQRGKSEDDDLTRGYIVMPNDWPTNVPSPDLTSEQMAKGLNKIADVYDDAMADLRDTPVPSEVR
jgi:hypothetical protein